MVDDSRESRGAPPDGSAPHVKTHFSQGFVWESGDASELRAVVEAAFDYRGNVTLDLEGDERVEGYLFNRDADGAEPWIEIFPRDGGPRRRISCGAIRAIHFSGKDTASGKSWERWAANYKAKKAARERGEDVGEIGLFPEEAD